MAPLGSYASGQLAESAAEIVAFHAGSKRILTVNALSGEIDVLDASDPQKPTKIGSVSAGADKEINSVTVREDGLAVAAVQQNNKVLQGEALFFDAAADDLGAAELGRVTIGALPDNVHITDDGAYALVANEGEPSNELIFGYRFGRRSCWFGLCHYAAPAPGAVEAATQADVRTASFEAFDTPGACTKTSASSAQKIITQAFLGLRT